MNPFVPLLALLSVTAGCASGATHPVTVRVIARTEAGDVMPQVPLGVSTGASAGYGLTGPDGVLTLTLDADDDTFQAVSARLFGNFRRADVEHLRPMAWAQYKALREQYFFETAYVQPAATTATDVDVTVIAYPAVTVTAKIQLGSRPAFLMASVGGGTFWELVETDTEVVIKGVRRGAPATLHFGSEAGELFTRTLTAAQTQAAVALGDVVFQSHATDAKIQLAVTNRAQRDERLLPLDRAIFLVRADGEVQFCGELHADGRMIDDHFDGKPTFVVPIPAGTYYVIPGSPGGAQQNKLVAMIAAGNLAALDAAGVPRVQVTAGQTREATVDAAKAYAAIKTAKP